MGSVNQYYSVIGPLTDESVCNCFLIFHSRNLPRNPSVFFSVMYTSAASSWDSDSLPPEDSISNNPVSGSILNRLIEIVFPECVCYILSCLLGDLRLLVHSVPPKNLTLSEKL